jgi:hypothetical protein
MAFAIFILHAQGVMPETSGLAVGTTAVLRVPEAPFLPRDIDLCHGNGKIPSTKINISRVDN